MRVSPEQMQSEKTSTHTITGGTEAERIQTLRQPFRRSSRRLVRRGPEFPGSEQLQRAAPSESGLKTFIRNPRLHGGQSVIGNVALTHVNLHQHQPSRIWLNMARSVNGMTQTFPPGVRFHIIRQYATSDADRNDRFFADFRHWGRMGEPPTLPPSRVHAHIGNGVMVICLPNPPPLSLATPCARPAPRGGRVG